MIANNKVNLGRTTFIANTSTTHSNVTGDGTVYTVIFDTTTANEGSNYNTSTGIFTAPVAGNYLFNTTVELTGITSAMTYAQYAIAGTVTVYVNAYECSYSGTLIVSAPLTLALAQGATVAVTIQVAGGTKVVSIANSFFSGFQIL